MAANFSDELAEDVNLDEEEAKQDRRVDTMRRIEEEDVIRLVHESEHCFIEFA